MVAGEKINVYVEFLGLFISDFIYSLIRNTISQHTVTKESKFLIFKSMSNLSKMCSVVKADR